MRKNFSDPNIACKSQEKGHYYDCSKDNTMEVKDVGNCSPIESDSSLLESFDKSVENKEKVAEKVEGVTSSSAHLFTPSSSSSSFTNTHLDSTYTNSSSSDVDLNGDSLNSNSSCSSRIDHASLNTSASTNDTAASKNERAILSDNAMDAGDLVRDLESSLEKKLSPRQRRFVYIVADIHIRLARGITVKDVEKSMAVKRDYAEKIIYEATKAGILTPLLEKDGKMNLSALTNYKHILDSKFRDRVKEEVLPNDISLILARELSQTEYVYHNIELAITLNYVEDYDQIRWPVKSRNNKQKVAEFRLESRRTCSFIVSPTGTVSIYVGCTDKPYRFHKPTGLVSFFSTCGQVLAILQTASGNRFNVVPMVEEWNLQRFDYNKDIPTGYLQKKVPAISWSSKGILKIGHLGVLFQTYSKHMPFEGERLRFEGHYTTSKKENVVDKISDIVNEDRHPFTTFEEMLEEKYLDKNSCKKSPAFNRKGLNVSINKTRGI